MTKALASAVIDLTSPLVQESMRPLPLLVLLPLVSCGPDLTGSSSALCTDAGSPLTYDNFGASFLSSYCVSCHGGSRSSGGVSLATAADASRYATAIVSAAGTRASMPPSGAAAPSAAERAELVQWLSCGAAVSQ
jgi:hypothetical protein